MGESIQKIYWDTCAFLALLNEEVGRIEVLAELYNQAMSGRVEIWTSTLTVAECRRLKSEENDTKPLSKENLETIKSLFRQDFMMLIPLSREIADNARSILRETSGLSKWQDAVHIASAQRFNLGQLQTYDAKDMLHLDGHFTCDDGKTKLAIKEPGNGMTISLMTQLDLAAIENEEE